MNPACELEDSDSAFTRPQGNAGDGKDQRRFFESLNIEGKPAADAFMEISVYT